MRDKPLTQRPISETNDNYGEMWYVFVKEMVMGEYGNLTNFMNAYGTNPNGVFRKLNSEYQTVPFDFKDTLQKIYSEKMTRGVA